MRQAPGRPREGSGSGSPGAGCSLGDFFDDLATNSTAARQETFAVFAVLPETIGLGMNAFDDVEIAPELWRLFRCDVLNRQVGEAAKTADGVDLQPARQGRRVCGDDDP